MAEKKERRPLEERRAIKKIMTEKNVKYTKALRMFEAEKGRKNE